MDSTCKAEIWYSYVFEVAKHAGDANLLDWGHRVPLYATPTPTWKSRIELIFVVFC